MILSRKRDPGSPKREIRGQSAPLVALKSYQEARSESEQIETAAAIIHSFVEQWWKEQAVRYGTQIPVRPPFAEIDKSLVTKDVRRILEPLARSIVGYDTQGSAFLIGQLYSSLLPDAYRARNGVFYTPPGLAARLLDQAEAAGVDWRNAKVIDPACGGGAFLAPVAERVLERTKRANARFRLRRLSGQLKGLEIDPIAGWLSQVALDIVALPLTAKTGEHLERVVEIADSLRPREIEAAFDLVVGNPPYGRVRLDESDRSFWARGLFGHANLYGLFTDLSIRLASDGGVVALVLPTSFAAGEYFKNLRRVLRTHAPPVSIDFVDARRDVFAGVLQEALLMTCKKAKTRAKTISISNLSLPALNHPALVEELGRASLPGVRTAPWILPRERSQVPWIRVLNKQPARLSDWGYTVSTGPLVWNRKKQQLRMRADRDCVPLIWSESVCADGLFRWPGRKAHHWPYFELTSRDSWLIADQPCVLTQRTTAKEQRKRLIATTLTAEFLRTHGGRVVIENHLNMLLPTDRPSVRPEVLAAFLNTAAADHAFRCLSGTVAVSASELMAMPLPSPGDVMEAFDEAGAFFEERVMRLYHSSPRR